MQSPEWRVTCSNPGIRSFMDPEIVVEHPPHPICMQEGSPSLKNICTTSHKKVNKQDKLRQQRQQHPKEEDLLLEEKNKFFQENKKSVYQHNNINNIFKMKDTKKNARMCLLQTLFILFTHTCRKVCLTSGWLWQK